MSSVRMRRGAQGEVRVLQWSGNEHEDGGEGDLESGEKAGRHRSGGMSEGEEVGGEGDRAEQREEDLRNEIVLQRYFWRLCRSESSGG